jgi:ferric-dicitrate binding protein FerR (iron transport regulator)
VAARRRRPVRRLWGRDHHGSFRTHGRGAVATVRGTTWAVADYCHGTRTSVRSGAVLVRNKLTGRTVLVRAGHSYFARTR